MKKEAELDGWSRLLRACRDLNRTDDFDRFFDLIFTPEEKIALSARIMIFKGLIDQKRTQRDLSKDLGVSIAKITRGSNAIKRASEEEIELLTKLFL